MSEEPFIEGTGPKDALQQAMRSVARDQFTRLRAGKPIDVDELSNIFAELLAKGAGYARTSDAVVQANGLARELAAGANDIFRADSTEEPSKAFPNALTSREGAIDREDYLSRLLPAINRRFLIRKNWLEADHGTLALSATDLDSLTKFASSKGFLRPATIIEIDHLKRIARGDETINSENDMDNDEFFRRVAAVWDLSLIHI